MLVKPLNTTGRFRNMFVGLLSLSPTPSAGRLRSEAVVHQPCDDPTGCIVCGWRDCPTKNPLHYHHDGCPDCHN